MFADRLTCEEDHDWLRTFLKARIENDFGMSWETVVPRARLLYGDFMFAGSGLSILSL